MHNDLNKLCKKMDKITSSTTIAGDFNAKIKKWNGSENCIGQCSVGRRNDSGFKLVEFCEMNNKVILNSCFHHPAKLITTWFQKQKLIQQQKQSPTYKIKLTTSSLARNKNTLNDAQSYGGTGTSDHRLVVARMEITWPRPYHQRIPGSHQQKFITKHLTQSKGP